MILTVAKVFRGNKKKITVYSLRLAMVLFLALIIIGFTGIHKSVAQTGDSMQKSKQSGLIYERIVVQPGDTLWDLAVKNNKNNPNNVINEIRQFNKLKSVYIEVGQVLYIPVNK
ncbi:MAG: LysM peptidoglycan-binding domain-containing protein [Peptococcaceae bacterium]|nr:LysM peptidoglycan-binding domain-containing protein [Peptococcaceae bacterium]